MTHEYYNESEAKTFEQERKNLMKFMNNEDKP